MGFLAYKMRSRSRKYIFKSILTIGISLVEEITYFAIQKFTIVEKSSRWPGPSLVMVKYYTTTEAPRKPGRRYRNKLFLASYK